MEKSYLTEAFKSLQILDEEDFSLTDSNDVEKIKDFTDADEKTDFIDIFDPEAESEEELEDSYVGKVICDCEVCHSKIYKEPTEIVIDEETQLANVGEECPYCYSSDGFKIIGQVAPFNNKEDVPEKDKEVGEIDVEKELDKEEKNECLSAKGKARLKKINESKKIKSKKKLKSLKERNLTRAERYNRDLQRIFDNSNKFEEQEEEFLLAHGVSSKEVKELHANTGLHGDAMRQKIIDMGLDKEFKKYAFGVNHQNKLNSLKEGLDLDKLNVFEFPNGESFYVDLVGGKLVAGSGTNNGITHDFEIDYNRRQSLDANLNALYDLIVKQRPELLDKNDLNEDVHVSANGENNVDVNKNDDGSMDIHVGGNQGGEEIVPLEPEMKNEIESNSKEQQEESEPEEPFKESEPEEIDYDVDDFDEDSFDKLSEGYLKKVYENVDSFKTTKVTKKGNTLKLEGLIKFNSGKSKKTSFVFEAKTADKKGNVKFLGENLQISRGKKSFTLKGNLSNKRFVSEALTYNYMTKNNDNKSVRLYGTIK